MDDEFDQGDMSPREDIDIFDDENWLQKHEKTFLTDYWRNQYIDWKHSQKLNHITKYAIIETKGFYTYDNFVKEKE